MYSRQCKNNKALHLYYKCLLIFYLFTQTRKCVTDQINGVNIQNKMKVHCSENFDI